MSDVETFGEQIRNAAAAKRFTKLRLVAELMESNRIISRDTRTILNQGLELNRLRAALIEIVESEVPSNP